MARTRTGERSAEFDGTASVVLARRVLTYAETRGVDVEKFLRELGLSRERLDDCDLRLPHATFRRMWTELPKLADDSYCDLTRQLLAFSRQQVLEPNVIDLGETVIGMERIVKRAVGEGVEVDILVSESPGRIFADPSTIEQVIMNLAVNARDAMPHGGRLTLETANVDVDADPSRWPAELTPGPHVVFTVSDTGVGMDEATRTRIFEPFFTTKGVGKGTGLGLSTTYGIVQQTGGTISVHSEPGVGTTFEIFFPRSSQSPGLRATSLVAPPSLEGDETILLVEDDDQVRSVVKTILRRRGYSVLEGRNGAEALLISEQHAGRIDALITDVVMPLMNGKQLAERLSISRPSMRVLFMSGYTDNVVLSPTPESGIELLPKPITPDTLLRKLRTVLSGAA